jgi:hypothetical protein
VGAVYWSPDSQNLLVVRKNWEVQQADQSFDLTHPIEVWGVQVESKSPQTPRVLFQSPSGEPGPEQINFGHWSPNNRYVVVGHL